MRLFRLCALIKSLRSFTGFDLPFNGFYFTFGQIYVGPLACLLELRLVPGVQMCSDRFCQVLSLRFRSFSDGLEESCYLQVMTGFDDRRNYFSDARSGWQFVCIQKTHQGGDSHLRTIQIDPQDFCIRRQTDLPQNSQQECLEGESVPSIDFPEIPVLRKSAQMPGGLEVPQVEHDPNQLLGQEGVLGRCLRVITQTATQNLYSLLQIVEVGGIAPSLKLPGQQIPWAILKFR